MSMRAKPWDVPDGLWERIEPLLPKQQRRFRHPDAGRHHVSRFFVFTHARSPGT
jgi:hypothetical protein